MTNASITDLKKFGEERGITIKSRKEIVEEATLLVKKKYGYSSEQIKKNFDSLLPETEKAAYKLYLQDQNRYGIKLFDSFIKELVSSGKLSELNEAGKILGEFFPVLDKFFLSLAQSRKSKAGKTFEVIHNTLFKLLDYPFDEQAVIDGKPDFVMPSVAHYKRNPLQCVIFTAKRTLRERWRQITTEGTKGIGMYLATIDEKISMNQLDEMHSHKIYVVCPKSIREDKYPDVINVLSFESFFEDHLDPKLKIWKRDGVI